METFKRVPIHTELVNPAYKPEIPDYRTEEDIEMSRVANEHDAINAGADAWWEGVKEAEEAATASPITNESDLINSGVDAWGMKNESPEVFFRGNETELTDTAEQESNEEPLVLTEEMRVAAERSALLASDASNENNTNDTFETNDAAEVVDQDAVDGILARLKTTKIANTNQPPTDTVKAKKLEVVGGTDFTPKLEVSSGQKFIRAFLNEKQAEFAAIDPKEYAGKGLTSLEIHRFESAYEQAQIAVQSLKEFVSSDDEQPISEIVPYTKAYTEALSIIEDVRTHYQPDEDHFEAEYASKEINAPQENEDRNERIDVSKIEDEIVSLDTDLNALTREINTWKADLETRKKYRRVKTALRSLIQKRVDGTEMVSDEVVAEKMQQLRDLHQAIFEFEMQRNGLLDEAGEVVSPPEEAPAVFDDTDEPELPFVDLPNVTKTGMLRTRAIQTRDESLEDAAGVASAAENLMLKELRNKGLQQEWKSGAFFGIGRAVSQMRVDDFLRTKDAHDKYRVWFSDLQERAGAFAPRLELGITLGEYVPKLYQGIVKAQQQAEQTGNEGVRARLLGI